MPIVSGMTPQENVDLSGTAICLLDAGSRKFIEKMNQSIKFQNMITLFSTRTCSTTKRSITKHHAFIVPDTNVVCPHRHGWCSRCHFWLNWKLPQNIITNDEDRWNHWQQKGRAIMENLPSWNQEKGRCDVKKTAVAREQVRLTLPTVVRSTREKSWRLYGVFYYRNCAG